MDFQIVDYRGTLEEDGEIASLMARVYVKEGYTDEPDAKEAFAPDRLRRRGEIILARASAGELVGMVICVRPASPARQVAMADEAEIHLLVVQPEARAKGVASGLVAACEQRAALLGFSKMVLSTQPAMDAARRVYERLGYRRNSARDWSKSNGRNYLVYEKSIGQNNLVQNGNGRPL